MSKQQFDTLYTAWKNRAVPAGLNAGPEAAVLREQGLLGPDGSVTPAGVQALEPYKVTNAVIMAAGKSSRFAPLSYEKPKGLIRVKGEIMIERQIRQLQDAGIRDITVIVGYMKEKMLYLGEKFRVGILANDDYYRYNNPSSLIRVADRLDNTYICSSDDYFPENPFEPYVYAAYYPVFFVPGKTDEYCAEWDGTGRITRVTIGGTDAWAMVGHVYFSRAFSRAFVRILKREYASSLTRSQLWEDLYVRYLRELPMFARRYDSSQIKEFDSLEELRSYDGRSIGDADSRIFRSIGRVLSCGDRDITEICPLKGGLKHLAFAFSCRGQRYVYRHPADGPQGGGAAAAKIAQELGLDRTVVFFDAAEGWKISRFVEHAAPLDFRDARQVREALGILRRLHRSGRRVPNRSDLWADIAQLETEAAACDGLLDLSRTIGRLRVSVKRLQAPECLCHCACRSAAFLTGEDGKMDLTDWESSGMADPARDLGTLLADPDCPAEQAGLLAGQYLGRRPEPAELARCFAYAAAASYFRLLQETVYGMAGPEADRNLAALKSRAALYGKLAERQG